jgi:hypothetical protein
MRMLPRRIATGLVTATLMASAGAAAAKDDDDFSIPSSGPARFDTETENIFGFTEGSDTGDQGEKEIGLEAFARSGKRAGLPLTAGGGGDDAAADALDPVSPTAFGRSRFRALGGKASLQYGITDDLSIEAAVYGDTRQVQNIAGVPDKSFGAFDGGSIELKYRLIDRTQSNPFGLAISIEPQWSRVDETSGQGVNAYSLETRIMADLRIIPDRLWFATNLVFEPEVSRTRGSNEGERQSGFEWSNALSLRLSDAAFVGAEVRYLASFDGSFLNRFQGQAIYVGPTFHYRFNKNAFVTAAFSAQVAGHERELPLQAFNLTDFDRYQLKLKAGVQF